MTISEVETAKGLCEHGRFSEAIRVLRVAETREPGNVDVLLQMASCYSALGMPAMAVEYERRASLSEPTRTQVWTAMGSDLRRMGDLTRSANAYGRALELDPGLGVAAYELARVAALRKDAKGAVEAMARAVALNPDYAAQAKEDETLARFLEEGGFDFGSPKRRRT